MQGIYILISVLALWLTALTVLLLKIYALFKNLNKGVEIDLSKKGFAEVNKRLDILEDDGKRHTQKMGLVRFNPFKELGGNHSFSLSLLDGHDSGIVITSLHTRDRTRIYIKEIKKGKSVSELSSEEKKAIDQVINK